MQATITDIGTHRKKLTFSFNAAECSHKRSTLLKKIAGQVNLNGFRPGKSSGGLVEKRYGSVATKQAQEELQREGLKQAIAEHSLQPLGPITQESVDEVQGLTVVCSFDVRPAVTFPAPCSLTVSKGPATISDAQVDEAIANLCARAGVQAELEAGVTIIKDDTVTLTGTVNVNGKDVRKLHDFHHVVGSFALLGVAPDEVVALMKDKTVGSHLTFSATLPATFSPTEAANQKADISVTIQSAKRMKPAEANDELAKRVGAESFDALKTQLRERLVAQAEETLHRTQLNELNDALLAAITFDLPTVTRDLILNDMTRPMLEQAKKDGSDAEKIAKDIADAAPKAEQTLKRLIIIENLAEQLGINVTKEEFESQIMMAAAQHKRKPQDIIDELVKRDQVNQVLRELRDAKTMEVLLLQVLAGKPSLMPEHGHPGHQHGPECAHEHA